MQRLTKTHDSRIANATAQCEETPRDPASRMELARAHFELASSGILDSSTAAFHFRAAVSNADTAREAQPDDLSALLLTVSASARRGDLDDAEARYAHEPADTESPEVLFERRWATTRGRRGARAGRRGRRPSALWRAREEAQTRTSDEWATTRSAPSSACPTPRMTAEEEREATRGGGGRCWHEQPPLHVRRQGMHVYVFVR